MGERRHITLGELQREIRGTLEERFAEPVWVSAEIADMKVNGSGHCYLELVEKDDNIDGVARAQARGVIWRSQYTRIAGLFEMESGRRLERGISILIRAAVTYHELYGLSLQITDIDPAYTLGDMELRKQQTIARLKSDGVWDMNRETDMPVVVQRIAVVSSSTAAGYQDFRNELAKSGYAYSLTLFDSVMQGASSEESVIASLESIAEAQEQFDAAVIIRGGGAVSDLNCFNSYRLSSHIAQFPLPIITGIGHDKDVSVADMVAHTALKTPTAVAVWLNERMAQAEGALEYAAVQLHDLFAEITRSHELRLERASGSLGLIARNAVEREAMRLGSAEDMLAKSVAELFERQRSRLSMLSEIVDSRSPEHIMRLGFSVARIGGKAITSVQELKAGDVITVSFADGEAHTEVKNIVRK